MVPEYQDADQSLPVRTSHFNEAEMTQLGSPDETPMLVVLHGLSGGSHEIYLRSVLLPIIQAGWEACVVYVVSEL